MEAHLILLTILGMVVVTYLPRLLPLLLLAARPLPPLVATWLRYVPVAVLAAMLLPDLLLREQQLAVRADNLFLWAALPTFLAAWLSRSFLGAVATGMGAVALCRYAWGI